MAFNFDVQIVVYTLLCLAVTCYALTQVVCTFREIRSYEQSAHLSWDSLFNRQSLINFNHRAKAFSGYLVNSAARGARDAQSQLLLGSAPTQSDEEEQDQPEEEEEEHSDEDANEADEAR